MANLEKIGIYLKKQHLPFKLVDLKQEAYTVGDVVKSGIDPEGVVKTLIIRTSSSFVALALRGNDRVDFKKVRTKFGGKTELAKPSEVLKVVGVPVGAVCPILVGVPLYVDKKVLDLEEVHMGSGDLLFGLEMKLGDFKKATRKYETMEFAQAVLD